MPRIAIALSFVLFLLLIIVYPKQVYAQEVSICPAAFIDGNRVEGREFHFDKDSVASVSGAAPANATRNSVHLEIFGIPVGSPKVPDGGGDWSITLEVSDITQWSVLGSFIAVWESFAEDGSLLCRTTTTIIIDGSPFEVAGGIAGTATAVVGLFALVFTLKTTLYEGGRFILELVLPIQLKRERAEGRHRWSVRLSLKSALAATFWGAIFSGGLLVMIQEAALHPPTVRIALELTIPIVSIGAVGGLFQRR